MESMADVLGRFNPDTPDELLAIKKFIQDEFKAPASTAYRGETIVVTVSSGALANTLRLRIHDLRKAAGTSKRVMFRIG